MLTNEEWRLIDVIGQSPKTVYKDGGVRSTLATLVTSLTHQLLPRNPLQKPNTEGVGHSGTDRGK